MLAARLLLAGESLVGEGEEDAFEGLSPQVPHMTCRASFVPGCLYMTSNMFGFALP